MSASADEASAVRESSEASHAAEQHAQRSRRDIVFADKKINSAGLQIADLLVRPIGLHNLRPGQPNRTFEIIAPKPPRSQPKPTLDIQDCEFII